MKTFGFAGYSGAGKTTLIEQLIPRFKARGLSVSLIKHTHHNFDVDHPGKDSYRHRAAGAGEVLLTCDTRWVLMHELQGQPEPSLQDQLGVLSPCDLVLVEGFKQTTIPKLEVHRPAHGKPPIWPDNPSVIVVATDAAVGQLVDCPLPQLDLNDVDAIATFILKHLEMPC
ncbi:MAG: molybdopterin-guanine dinucleotide biosynthesis protein B [Gammaproteobacteria bacterium]|nr:molybdopterin-guanine dinucleotide biosynthesis protein B [Rhodocyclaceae bacterium]MBU3908486.1 molybdopterin-guanine dinucleotide biosynthesis protein B [Gammaproteobacteria bacterium]MBU3988631.1 molybdopterin-guanine dinucleotide biosynthesis protein B [Gammaproteobacteria bacterium]MBU4004514.1 molybdopterin-guanine dinucleotide biosynthesis protein B [Gammaproteobacteria bacterium]MBU4021117.1 molybdopterin-guanine dinucleotide biosynthesis protein B [Gammaproteobacteria bacterium]